MLVGSRSILFQPVRPCDIFAKPNMSATPAPAPASTGHTAPSTADGLDLVLKAMADPTRIRVLNLLAAGEMCVCDIVQMLELPQPTVSRHLAVLRRAGLVVVAREARFAHYALAEDSNGPRRSLLEAVIMALEGVQQLEREREAACRRVATRRRRPC